ncbi:MAG TPA: hypothetical protein PLQ88_15520, partial [Blastocatellia bacterium]|nr:hypothetical protein [Blastocatellia bacterium]
MKRQQNQKLAILSVVCLTFCLSLFWWVNRAAVSEAASQATKSGNLLSPLRLNLPFQAMWEKRWQLKRGETFELSVGLPQPSLLPQHGRVGVRWVLEKADAGEVLPAVAGRKADAFGIYTA